MSKELVKPVSILTEEELKRFEDRLQQLVQSVTIKSIILEITASHRALYAANAELSNTVVKQNSANLKLVYENDELMAENVKLKNALNSIVEGDWARSMDEDGLATWYTDRIDPKKIALEALEETK